MKRLITVSVLLALLTALATGCATYTFKCAKSVSWALQTESNPAVLTGMCDGKKTVVLEGPGPAAVEHLCDAGKVHWFVGNKLTCIDDPCAAAKKVSVFNPDRSIVCNGNQ